MTIEYKDSKRIVGLSTDIVQTLTFEDDFSSDNWTNIEGSSVGVSGGSLVYNAYTGGGSNGDGEYRDYGSVLSDTFVWRFKWNATNIIKGSNLANNEVNISISSNTSKNDIVNDAVGFLLRVDSANKQLNAGIWDNTAPASTASTNTALEASTFSAGTYYCEVVRLSNRQFKFTLYSDSNFSTSAYTTTLTNPADLLDLRYFKVTTDHETSADSANDGSLDDFKLYNGVTSITSKPTDVQDNSLLVEKDTARRYWRTPDQATVSDDLTTNKGWTATGTGNGYNASDYIDFKMVSPDASSGSDRDTVYIDLQDADYLNGSNISDSAFVVRCKINFSALANASVNENRNYFGFFSDDAWGGTAQDFFVLQVLATTSALSFIVGCSNNTTMEGGQDKNGTAFTATPTINTDYYVTFTRDGTSFKCRITTNSDYSGGQEMSATTTSNISNLRYFGWKGRGDTQANGGNTQGTIKPDIRIYNAVTTATPATWTLGGFQPTDISSLAHWYDASDSSTITKDGSNRVSQWNDKKGSDNLVQATSGNQPLWTDADQNSKAVIDFVSSRYMANSASSVAQPNTYFVALTAPASSGSTIQGLYIR